MDQQQRNGHGQDEAFPIPEQIFSDVGVDVEDAAVERFVLLRISADGADHLFDLVDLFVDAFDVFPPRVEDEFLFQVVAVDEQVSIFLCLAVGNYNPVLQGEIQLQVAAQVYHLRYPVHDHVFLRFEVWVMDWVPS